MANIAPFIITPPVITPEALPGMLAEIARIVTPDAAVAIAREFGGRRLYIPKAENLKPTHPLARLVGLKAARLIAAHFLSDTYRVPTASHYLRWHDARVLRLRGWSHARIAKKLRLHQKRVADLLGGLPAGTPEADDEESPLGPAICPACGHRRLRSAARTDPRQLELL